MESLKSMLVAVSALRMQAEYMCDVADDLAQSLAGLRREPGYDAPISLFDVELGYDYREIYMPGHPAADARGYVRAEDFAAAYPVETNDTQIAYEAQLEAMKEALEAELPAPDGEVPGEDDEELIALYG
jgi:flagellar basal body rod protein FlgC